MLWHSPRTSCLSSRGTTKSRFSLSSRLSPEDSVVIQEEQVPIDEQFFTARSARTNSPSSGSSSPSSQAKMKVKSTSRDWQMLSSSGVRPIKPCTSSGASGSEPSTYTVQGVQAQPKLGKERPLLASRLLEVQLPDHQGLKGVHPRILVLGPVTQSGNDLGVHVRQLREVNWWVRSGAEDPKRFSNFFRVFFY